VYLSNILPAENDVEKRAYMRMISGAIVLPIYIKGCIYVSQ